MKSKEQLDDVVITIVDTQEGPEASKSYKELLPSEQVFIKPAVVIEAGRRWKECIAPGTEFPKWEFPTHSDPKDPNATQTRKEYAELMYELIEVWTSYGIKEGALIQS